MTAHIKIEQIVATYPDESSADWDDKPITIKKFGNIFEDGNGDINITGFHFDGNGNQLTATNLANCIRERIIKSAENGLQFGELTCEKVENEYITAEEAHYSGYHNIANEDFSKTDCLYNLSYLHRDFEKWQAAEEFGRKQALEDALAIVKNENKTGAMEFEIKELLND